MQPDMPVDEDPAVLQDEFAVAMLDDAGEPLQVDAYATLLARYVGASEVPCYGVACVEGIPDGANPRRMFSPGSLEFAPFPLSFKWQVVEAEGHEGAIVDGRVDAMWRDGALIRWIGALDNVGQLGREAIRMIAAKFVTGVSIMADDTEDVDIEYVYVDPAAPVELAVEMDVEGGEEFHLPGQHNQKDHGNSKGPKSTRGPAPKGWKPNPKLFPKGLPGQSASDTVTADGLDLAPIDGELVEAPEPNLMVIHHARVRSLTLVAEAAFVECRVYLGESPDQPPMVEVAEDAVLMAPVEVIEPGADPYAQPVATVAAAYTITIPDIWPESWFEEPRDLPPFGALHITAAGRVYGLLGPSRVSHRGFRASGQHVEIPRGIDYSEFQNKPALVAGADGHVYQINAGNVTFDCGHASPVDQRRADPSWAMSHYDNTCSIAARIRVGENKHGTWVAGALMHGISPDAVERMMASALSGDWQGGRLNAALLVPVEGFPTRVAASVRVRSDVVVASSVPIHFEEPYVEPEFDYGYVFDLIASANGRPPMGLFDTLAEQRFDELARG